MKYIVELSKEYIQELSVEAETEDEAVEKARSLFNEFEDDVIIDWDILSITEME